MSPKKIAIFIVSVLLTLFLITFFSGRYQTSQGFDKEGIMIGNTMLKYPTSDILLKAQKKDIKNAKATKIIAEVKTVEEENVGGEKNNSTTSEKQVPHVLETNVEGKIYYPDDVTSFIVQLKKKLNQKSCRIVHYGDSQIEGDRITVYVRNRFQTLFGGGGPGFVPIKIAYPQNSINLSASSNWIRFASFDRNKKNPVKHEKYGLYTTFSRFAGNDLNVTDTTSVKKAHFTVKPSKAYNRLRTFTRFGLHYGNNTTPTKITVYQNGNLIKQEWLQTDGKYHHLKIEFADTPKEIKVELEGKISPDFYGITLDKESGISMDNVAMRGEAGRVFTRINYENFKQMSAELKPDVFIFQYGGNTIPYIRKDKQVKDYVHSLMQNIKWVKRSNPHALFIVIGPGDMSISENGKMTTYPFLPKLNEAMKEKCLENGVAFWSIYEAMGGENSMVAWVEKGMAASDYVHLRPKGTQVISELFFQCLHNDILAVE